MMHLSFRQLIPTTVGNRAAVQTLCQSRYYNSVERKTKNTGITSSNRLSNVADTGLSLARGSHQGIFAAQYSTVSFLSIYIQMLNSFYLMFIN